MSIIAAIDTALTKAETEKVRVFRIHLREAEIEGLRTLKALGEPLGGHRAAGAYKGVNVFESTSASELLAQPEDQFAARRFVIEP